MSRPYIIAVDFDGTLCENEYPAIGEPNHDIMEYIRIRHQLGAKIILWTCRTGEELKKAVDWCYQWAVPLNAVNENIPEVIEEFGGDTRKIFADEYIDDKMFIPGKNRKEAYIRIFNDEISPECGTSIPCDRL